MRFNKKQAESPKTKNAFNSSYIESFSLNPNPDDFKLRMLQEILKCKQFLAAKIAFCLRASR